MSIVEQEDTTLAASKAQMGNGSFWWTIPMSSSHKNLMRLLWDLKEISAIKDKNTNNTKNVEKKMNNTDGLH